MHLSIETELEDDGRWIAEVPQLPGVLAYGATEEEASARAEMFEERPQIKSEVRVESRDSLAECLEQGLLAEVFVDGVWSGLIAARRDMGAGLRGLHMIEILLTKSARGQGLGPAVHQRFARSVAAVDPAAILMGTISAKNAPSLRAALRAGRLEVGAFRWVDL